VGPIACRKELVKSNRVLDILGALTKVRLHLWGRLSTLPVPQRG
jgi:hypothetical protein